MFNLIGNVFINTLKGRFITKCSHVTYGREMSVGGKSIVIPAMKHANMLYLDDNVDSVAKTLDRDHNVSSYYSD